MTTVLLARHGETDWNRDERFQGHADPPLNESGRDQAERLAARVSGLDVAVVYASDLQRARATAAIVGERLGLEVDVDPRLREIDVGEWSGLTIPEIATRFPAGLERHRAGGDGWEKGETHTDMQTRAVGTLRSIAAAHPNETVLVVTHGGVIRALLAQAAGVELAVFRRSEPGAANGDIRRIEIRDGAFSRLD